NAAFGRWSLDNVSVTPTTPVVVSPNVETVTGQITFTDANPAETHTVSVIPLGQGYLGDFRPSLTDTTGNKTGTVDWLYLVNDQDIEQKLAADEIKIQTYKVTIDDHHGGVISQDVVITIHAANHQPTILHDT